MKLNPPCKDCEMRCVGCHGKERGEYRCKAWGAYREAWEAVPPPAIDPVNGYAADRRRWRYHKKHMERRL